jgi:peptidoglycan/LPS O-acetylase OafA/YrhL
LRAIAVLAIVVFHAFPEALPGGFIGVDIFIVISGYLISSIVLPSLTAETFSFIDFYARRVRRIFPALAVALLTCGIVGWFVLFEDEYRQLAKHSLGAAFFVSNFMFWGESGYFDQSADSKVLLHLWSLGIEEQFYIIYPLLLYTAWRFKIQPIVTIAVLAAISFGLNIVSMTRSPAADFFLPQNRAWELMIGSFLAALEIRCGRATLDRPMGRFIISGIGAALMLSGFVSINRSEVFPGWNALLPTVGTTLLIAAGPTSTLNRIL